MQSRSRILILILLAILISVMLVLAVTTYGLFRKALPASESALRYPYQQLRFREQRLYTALCDGIRAHKDKIKLPGMYDEEDYKRVYLLVAEQEPEFFYLDNVFESAEVMSEVNLYYTMDKEEAEQKLAELRFTAEGIAEKAKRKTHPIDQLLVIHDEIAERCEYKDGNFTHEAYGCLIEGKAKCEGYAKAFLYIARLAGLNVMNVTGKDATGENHVWNIAEADGNYYQIDVTWDDDAQYRGHYTHTCFAMTDDDFADHFADVRAFEPPACMDTENDYYHRERFWLDSGDAMLETIRTWPYDSGVIEFRMSSEAAMKEAKSLIEKGGPVRQEIINACGAMSYQALADDNRNVIVILPS